MTPLGVETQTLLPTALPKMAWPMGLSTDSFCLVGSDSYLLTRVKVSGAPPLSKVTRLPKVTT